MNYTLVILIIEMRHLENHLKQLQIPNLNMHNFLQVNTDMI